MKLFTAFQIVALSLLVAGCVTPAEMKEHQLEEKEQQMSMDHNQCVSYGFPANTVEYSNCLMKLDQQRIDAENKKLLQEEQAVENQKALRQLQNPGKICNSTGCY